MRRKTPRAGGQEAARPPFVQPSNVVSASRPDRVLQGRLFGYSDAQRSRLGVNHHLIPVNAARCSVHGFSRDGATRVDGNYGSTPHYGPNSNGTRAEQPGLAEQPFALDGAAERYNYRADDDDYYTQPGLLFRLMDRPQQQALFANTGRATGDASLEVKAPTSATA